MAPLDWNKLMALDPHELEGDDAAAEDIYTVLSEVGRNISLYY